MYMELYNVHGTVRCTRPPSLIWVSSQRSQQTGQGSQWSTFLTYSEQQHQEKSGQKTLKPRLWDNLENPESPTGVYLINHIQITAMECQSCSVCHEPKDIGHRGLRICPWFHQKPAFSLICWRGKWTKLVCGLVSAKLTPAREDRANTYYCSREGENSRCFGETRPLNKGREVISFWESIL